MRGRFTESIPSKEYSQNCRVSVELMFFSVQSVPAAIATQLPVAMDFHLRRRLFMPWEGAITNSTGNLRKSSPFLSSSLGLVSSIQL